MTQKAYVTNGYLSDIASAIRYKNGQSSTYLPFEMASAIRDIPAGPTPTGQIEITENGTYDVSSYASANVEVSADFEINDVSALFYQGARVDELEKYLQAISKNPTGASYMFYSCSLLTSLDLSNLNTSNVTNMTGMFFSCSSLASLDLSSFDTSKVTSMLSMFSTCSSLTSLDLSSFDTSNVTTMRTMFNKCSSLTNLKIGKSNSTYSNITDSSLLFANCITLDSVTINGTTVLPITDSSAFNNLKSTCKFYVPSNLLSQYKSATNWSTRASYIYAIS